LAQVTNFSPRSKASKAITVVTWAVADREVNAMFFRFRAPNVILFVSANPFGTSQLANDQECAAIENELRRTPYRDAFELRSKWAVNIDELSNHLIVVA
jgi:hypothetical protein